jgi:ZIP family zinc transporter
MISIWLQAGFRGFVTGVALPIGAAIAYFAGVSQRLIAAIMVFDSGMLISA